MLIFLSLSLSVCLLYLYFMYDFDNNIIITTRGQLTGKAVRWLLTLNRQLQPQCLVISLADKCLCLAVGHIVVGSISLLSNLKHSNKNQLLLIVVVIMLLFFACFVVVN